MDSFDTNKTPPKEIRAFVKDRYGKIAQGQGGCCDTNAKSLTGCCGDTPQHAKEIGSKIGYSATELSQVPQGANLGLGCGNPTAIDTLKPGEVVLDLGSGAGMDVFLAANQVGPTGKVIGVDMTEEMIVKAKENAEKSNLTNVDFRLGTIESLPVEDESVDAIISNCVINLSPEKDVVFREAYRVLNPGGRLMISDIVLEKPLPKPIAESLAAYAGCIAGAEIKDRYLTMIKEAGFNDIQATSKGSFAGLISESDPLVSQAMDELEVTFDHVRDVLSGITSLNVFARKPAS
jgi:arsenite methyltransferase